MRVIKPSRLREFGQQHAAAQGPLARWLQITRSAAWANLVDVRKTFRHADEVRVRSGRTVVVFNVKGNDFRLITAIHYNLGKVFVMLFLTHAEYDRQTWKDHL